MRISFISMDMNENRGGSLYEKRMVDELRERFDEEQLRVIDNAGELRDQSSGLFQNKELLRFITGYRKHAKELLDCDYLCINLSTYMNFACFPWRLKKKSGCRIIAITHHLDYMGCTGRRRAEGKFFTKKLMKHTDCILTPNPYTRDLMASMGFGDKMRLVETYLDKTIHEITVPREEIVLTVGGVERRKGLEYGIEAFAKFSRNHSDYRYVIVGQVNADHEMRVYYEQLKTQIRDLGVEDKITFTGNISEEEKDALYRKAGMFLFPSQLEGYGWVMIEAMSYGDPVIAFDVSAMPYTVNASNGVLVPNRDTDAMSRAMAGIADDSGLYASLSDGARQTVRALPDRETIKRQEEAFLKDMADRKV